MTVYNVSSASQLANALKTAGGGDVVKLGAGNYGKLTFDRGQINAGVTITSAGEGSAKFASLTVKDAKGLVLDGLAFGGAGGNGLKINGGVGVVVKNSDFSQITNGATFSRVTGLVVENNFFTNLKHDAMRFAGVNGVLIKDNDYVENGSAKGFTHKDFIQFWTNKGNNEGSSSYVKIVGNKFSSNDGLTHGILVLNESKYGFHKNFVIENNDFNSSHVHGISLMDVAGLDIRDNTLTHNKGGGNSNAPLINVTPNSQSVTITGNKAPSIPDEGNSSWSVWGNVETSGSNLKHWLGGKNGSKVNNGPPKGGDNDSGGKGGPKDGPKGEGGETLKATSKANVLIGSEGADRFVFDSVSDSRPGSRDVIRPGDGASAFQGAGKPGGDRIDLSDIDANRTKGGDQDFDFGKAGKGGISLVNRGGDTLVRGNIDNDKAFEFAVLIDDGGVRPGAYSAGDFIL